MWIVRSQFTRWIKNHLIDIFHNFRQQVLRLETFGQFRGRRGDIALSIYCNNDWVGHIKSLKPTGGYTVQLKRDIHLWRSFKQSYVAACSTDAKYIPYTELAQGVLYYPDILQNLTELKNGPLVHEDNYPYIAWAPSMESVARMSKHATSFVGRRDK